MPSEPLIGPIHRHGAFAGFDQTTGPVSIFLVNGRKVLPVMSVLKSKIPQVIGLKKRLAISSKTA
jgi:hypothetical protein